MYTNVSEAFVRKITSYSRTFRAKLVFGDKEITDGIYSIKTKGGSCADTDLKVGSTVAATADIELEETSFYFKNKELELYIGLMLDHGSIEYVPYGVYTVRAVSTKDRKTTLTVADRMYRADRVYKTNLTFPSTADKVVEEICGTLNVPYDIEGLGLENITIPFTPSAKATMREMLGKLAALAGKNAMFDRTGTLVFKWYEESGFETDYDYIDNPEIDEEDFSIRYLMCEISSTNTETLGDDKATQGMSIVNEFALTSALEKVWEQIGGFSYRPVDVKMILGDIRLDPWDIFVVNMNGKRIKTICMNIDFEYDGGLSCTVSATAPDTDSEYLTPAEIQAQKQAEKEQNNSLLLIEQNEQACEVSSSEKRLLGLQFNTQTDAQPYMTATVQIEETSAGVITVLVKTNGSVYSSYRISAVDGYNLMSFCTAFLDLPTGSNQMELYILGSADNMGVVQARQATIILTGNGLLSRSEWDGTIHANDEFEPFVIEGDREEITIVSFAENLSAKTQYPQLSDIKERLGVIEIKDDEEITISDFYDFYGGNRLTLIDSEYRTIYTSDGKAIIVKRYDI